jgi:hypothetical protein
MHALLLTLALAGLTADDPCRPDAPDVAAAGGDACAPAWMDRSLGMNAISAVGTHNSYKLFIPEGELIAMRIARGDQVLGVDYGHRSLPEQLEAGARQLEIDVLHDPDGGRYARPLTALGGGIVADPAWRGAMMERGFKTLHMPDVDFRSSCWTFRDCLVEIDVWSRNHPDHAPILIMLNAKDGEATMPGGVTPLPFDAAAFDALDAEIRAVFGPERLITPDEVRGGRATLREAVLAGGWPRLGQARGRVFFALDESPAKVELYRDGRRSLEGRAMFVNTDETADDAAYLTLNDPVAGRSTSRPTTCGRARSCPAMR